MSNKQIGKTKVRKNVSLRLGLLTLAVAAMGGIGCNGGGGGGGTYYPAWYNVYGDYCGSGSPTPGCNFYSDGVKIIASEDSAYASNYFSWDTYVYYDSYGFLSSYTGYGWVSASTGILYRDDGYALNSDEGKDSRDLMGQVGDAETKVVETAGKAFADKYSLSEDVGISVAKTLNEYATFSYRNKRFRTDQDVKDFGKRLFGVDPNRAERALNEAKKGDSGALLGLNDEVATFWGTNPETSKAILKSWYKNQLSEIKVK